MIKSFECCGRSCLTWYRCWSLPQNVGCELIDCTTTGCLLARFFIVIACGISWNSVSLCLSGAREWLGFFSARKYINKSISWTEFAARREMHQIRRSPTTTFVFVPDRWRWRWFLSGPRVHGRMSSRNSESDSMYTCLFVKTFSISPETIHQ